MKFSVWIALESLKQLKRSPGALNDRSSAIDGSLCEGWLRGREDDCVCFKRVSHDRKSFEPFSLLFRGLFKAVVGGGLAHQDA
jgi:hypothetical protein